APRAQDRVGCGVNMPDQPRIPMGGGNAAGRSCEADAVQVIQIIRSIGANFDQFSGLLLASSGGILGFDHDSTGHCKLPSAPSEEQGRGAGARSDRVVSRASANGERPATPVDGSKQRAM